MGTLAHAPRVHGQCTCDQFTLKVRRSQCLDSSRSWQLKMEQGQEAMKSTNKAVFQSLKYHFINKKKSTIKLGKITQYTGSPQMAQLSHVP